MYRKAFFVCIFAVVNGWGASLLQFKQVIINNRIRRKMLRGTATAVPPFFFFLTLKNIFL